MKPSATSQHLLANDMLDLFASQLETKNWLDPSRACSGFIPTADLHWPRHPLAGKNSAHCSPSLKRRIPFSLSLLLIWPLDQRPHSRHKIERSSMAADWAEFLGHDVFRANSCSNPALPHEQFGALTTRAPLFTARRDNKNEPKELASCFPRCCLEEF